MNPSSQAGYIPRHKDAGRRSCVYIYHFRMFHLCIFCPCKIRNQNAAFCFRLLGLNYFKWGFLSDSLADPRFWLTKGAASAIESHPYNAKAVTAAIIHKLTFSCLSSPHFPLILLPFCFLPAFGFSLRFCYFFICQVSCYSASSKVTSTRPGSW